MPNPKRAVSQLNWICRTSGSIEPVYHSWRTHSVHGARLAQPQHVRLRHAFARFKHVRTVEATAAGRPRSATREHPIAHKRLAGRDSNMKQFLRFAGVWGIAVVAGAIWAGCASDD